MLGVVYLITNEINKLIYVGLTQRDVNTKFAEHKDERYYSSVAMYGDMRIYGVDNFTLSILERGFTNLGDLAEAETSWIAKLHARNPEVGYNRTKGGELGCSQELSSRVQLLDLLAYLQGYYHYPTRKDSRRVYVIQKRLDAYTRLGEVPSKDWFRDSLRQVVTVALNVTKAKTDPQHEVWQVLPADLACRPSQIGALYTSQFRPGITVVNPVPKILAQKTFTFSDLFPSKC